MSIPPTPTSIRSSSTRSSLYDRYALPPATAAARHHHQQQLHIQHCFSSSPPPSDHESHHHHELARIRTCLAQKEAENAALNQAVSEWQAKAQSYRDAHEKLQGQIRRMQAEMDAMKKVQVQRMDHDAQLILGLSKEVEQLKAAAGGYHDDMSEPGLAAPSPKDDPCVIAEDTYKTAASQVLYGRKKADTLILGISDMVRAIEDELAYLETERRQDDEESDAVSSIASPETPDQKQTDMLRVNPEDESKETPMPVSDVAAQPAAPPPTSSSSSSIHHRQQPQRTFRPRSQTMDTLVKKASMLLLRPSKRSGAEQAQSPRPTPSCTTPHPASSSRPTQPPPDQLPQQMPLPSRTASVQALNNAALKPVAVHKDKRRQSMIALPSSHPVSGSNVSLPDPPASSKSRLMHHYQQQQHAMQEHYQRRRRSAIVGGGALMSPLAAGGGCELKPTASEQWKISRR